MTDAAPVDLLIRDASWVVGGAGPDQPAGWVACTDGLVVAIGASGAEPPAVRALSAQGALVTPGLVNAHHHLFQNLTRAFQPVAELGLDGWLATLRPIWQRLDEEAAYESAWIGLAELALAGCTSTVDNIYLHPGAGLVEATIQAAGEVGLRLHACRGYLDRAVLDLPGAQPSEVILDETAKLLANSHDPSPTARIQIAVGPTALTASSTGLLADIATLAAGYGARLHTHLFEQPGETEEALRQHRRRPVALLVEAGWSDRAWIAHGSYAAPADLAALASAGMALAHCPSSNLFLGGAAAPIRAALDAGVAVGLGTDGAASAGLAALWLEARMAVLLARQQGGPAAMTARQALALATTGGAACLGRQGELGVLAVGAQADLAVWEFGGPRYAGAYTDPVESWLRCGPPAVRHTVVGGQPVVLDGELVAAGLDHRLAAHTRIARAWQQAG